MIEREAAPGIHRVECNHTSFCVVEDGDRCTVVDAGLTTSWPDLERAVGSLDRIGPAERLRTTLGIPVWVHENDVR